MTWVSDGSKSQKQPTGDRSKLEGRDYIYIAVSQPSVFRIRTYLTLWYDFQSFYDIAFLLVPEKHQCFENRMQSYG